MVSFTGFPRARALRNRGSEDQRGARGTNAHMPGVTKPDYEPKRWRTEVAIVVLAQSPEFIHKHDAPRPSGGPQPHGLFRPPPLRLSRCHFRGRQTPEEDKTERTGTASLNRRPATESWGLPPGRPSNDGPQR
ncbi:unnamed protein product [Lota lota]